MTLPPLAFHGCGLNRPECVLAHVSGLLFAADWTGPGGVAIIDPASGAVTRHLARAPDAGLKPNGIWLENGGSFLLAHLGDANGGVARLHPDGRHEWLVREVDGAPIPPTNFVAVDAAGRLIITVSTRHRPRHRAARADVRDGFVALAEPGGPARIVADGLGYTNECVLTADGTALLVNETFARETSRFSVCADGTLGPRAVVARYGPGVYPDGLALDAAGGFIVTAIVSNTVLRVAADGTQTVILEDRDEGRIAAVNAAYEAGALTRDHLDRPHQGPLKNVSSLAFGGPDLRTGYLGCLLGDQVASVAMPVAGLAPPHYRADIGPLLAALGVTTPA